MKILINRGNITNAKSYPFWSELLILLKEHEIREINGILPEQEIKDLVNWADRVVTIDTFLIHFIKYYKLQTPTIVLWALSDPAIFGYPEQINLLKHLKYLRQGQFLWWKDVVCPKEAWVSSQEVYNTIGRLMI
jgi:hypothetical protein